MKDCLHEIKESEPVWKANEYLGFDAIFEGKCIGAVDHLSDGSWGASFDGKRLHHRNCQYTLEEAKKCVEDFWNKDPK